MNVREWALPVYTILMQLAAGSLLTLWIIRTVEARRVEPRTLDHVLRLPVLAVWITILTAVVGAHFHLSHSYLSLLATLNWRTSWLSREVIFTILFFGSVSGLVYLLWVRPGHYRLETVLGWGGVVAGSLVIYSMSKIYLLPSQAAWNTPLTLFAFYLTAILLGVTAVAVLLVMDLKISEVAEGPETAVRRHIIRHSFGWMAVVAMMSAVVIPAINLTLNNILQHGDAPARTSLLLLLNLYQPLLIMRYIALFSGVGWFGVTAVRLHRRQTQIDLTNPVYLSCLLILIAEITGRFLFYATHIRTGI